MVVELDKLKQKVLREQFDNTTDQTCDQDFKDGADWAFRLVLQWIKFLEEGKL